ncbi:O-methyltransferase [Dyadobacter koreensis]|uniref:O-methyltransferase n=1 Tax=Dyadobacter koreensis TaxID=408657 RepID=A0A1H6R7Z5_9BACT|nr:TylF/MycF/NovP-related O-methyltransferase [Dyadobacter koreensis]SEI51941.1 O-methyltransferase [Dyadobacter koreensis]
MKRSVLKLVQQVLNNFNLALTRPNNNLGRERYISLSERMDYTRTATLDLLAHEIIKNNVKGQIAELGVFKGEFAKYLNRIFPDRPLHLFDTFEGFDVRDVENEKKNKFSTGDQNFSDTSVELVLSKMYSPDKCLVHKGFFPNTTAGLSNDLSFAFVSIDADLYQPIYEGLKYFYPKLSSGGYIFVHDFNNQEYSGANKAVLDFCNENKIPYTPTADGWGSVVIAK